MQQNPIWVMHRNTFTMNLTVFDHPRKRGGPHSKHISTVSAKSGFWSWPNFTLSRCEHLSYYESWIELFTALDICYQNGIVTRMCWLCTQMIPRMIVRIGERIRPPFLNASPIANTPDPILPFRMCISVSRNLSIYIMYRIRYIFKINYDLLAWN